MRRISVGALVVALLTACSSATETRAPRTTTSVSARPTSDAPLPFGARTDTTLVIAPGYGPLVAIDLDTGNAQRFDDTDGVPGDFPFRITGLEAGVAYPGSAGVRSLPWALDEPPATIGQASFFVPSGRADHLWLVDPPGDADAAVGLREVDAAGEVTAETAVPPGVYPVGGVGDLVVVQQLGDLALFDPAGRSVTRSLGSAVLLGTGGTRMATTEGCERRDTCSSVRVVDVEAPDEDVVAEVTGQATDAAFSPDGRWLAIWTNSDDGTTASLDLLDLTSPTVEAVRVEGSEAGPYADLAWSNDSDWVFALSRGVGRSGTMITAHHLGEAAAEVHTTPNLQTGSIVTIPDGEGPALGAAPDPRPCPRSAGVDSNTNPRSAVTAGHPCRLPLSP